VAVRERCGLRRPYEAFATPFAFLIDERGVIASKGIINNRQHIEFVLSGATGKEANQHAATGSGAGWPSDRDFPSHSRPRIEEKEHV
jgi:hypothetical protein